jgi:TM2 domain-containing membrane protein YozV
MKFCEHYGSEISMEAELCPSCGIRLETNEKNPAVAAVLSAIINGGGQLYNGDGAKGAIIFGVQIVNVMLMFVLIGFLTFPLVWLYLVYDAYKTAQSR